MARVIPHEGTADGPGWVVLVGRTWKQSPGLRGEGDRAKGFVGRVTLKKVFFFFFLWREILKEKYLRTRVPFIMGDTEEKEAGGERVKLETNVNRILDP